MLPEERDAAYLLDMLEAAQKIQRYVEGKSIEALERLSRNSVGANPRSESRTGLFAYGWRKPLENHANEFAPTKISCKRAITGQSLEADELLRDAVERNVEIKIIGEAARRVSSVFRNKDPEIPRNKDPEIPWRKIIAQRNVLIHEYDSIKDEELWSVATVHVPRLIRMLGPVIPPLPPEPTA